MPGDDAFGATPTAAGVRFRVWAPNATAVAVAGEFNGWGRTPLAPGDGGVWTAEVAGVRAGEQYRYVLTTPDGELQRIDPYARAVTSSAGRAIVYDEAAFDWGDAPYATPGWSELVIYELHVGTFNDLPGGAVGTLDDAAAKLPYLQDLGVNAVELLPVAEFATDSSWGYNPAVPFAVESAYGGPDALKRFVRAAHAAGIAVLLDVVCNHLGPGDLEFDLWQWDGTPPGCDGGVYFYGDWRQATDWGPRPDYGRDEVRRYLRDNALAWLGDARADGLRFDATAYIRCAHGSGDPADSLPDGWRLLREINEAIASTQPWKIAIAEDMRDEPAVTAPIAQGGAGFGAQWDARFLSTLRGMLTAGDDESRDMAALAGALTHRFGEDAFARVVYTESHDADSNGSTRVPTQIDPGDPTSVWAKKRSTLGAALVLTAPGIPMIFQGQEFLETHWFDDQHPPDWGNVDRHPGIVALYRDLIRLRRDWWDTTRGLRGQGMQLHHVNAADKLVAFHRWSSGGPRDDVVVLANCANRAYDAYTIGLPRGGRWRVRFNGDWAGYDPDFGGHGSFDLDAREEPRDGLPFSGDVGVGPYTAIVLSQDE